jgi:hypothetical protein
MEFSIFKTVAAVLTAAAGVLTASSMLFERGRDYSLAYPGRFVCLFISALVFVLLLVGILMWGLKASRSLQSSAPPRTVVASPLRLPRRVRRLSRPVKKALPAASLPPSGPAGGCAVKRAAGRN